MPNGTPTILAFAYDGMRLIVGLDVGVILAYDATMLCTSGYGYANPIRIRHVATNRSKPKIDILPHCINCSCAK